jgi:hypothetical protein
MATTPRVVADGSKQRLASELSTWPAASDGNFISAALVMTWVTTDSVSHLRLPTLTKATSVLAVHSFLMVLEA